MMLDVPSWRTHQASPGDSYEVTFLASRSTSNSDLAEFKTVLSQRPDLSVQGVTPISPTVIRASFRELGTHTLGAQLGPAINIYVTTAASAGFTPMSVVQTGGSTTWSRFLASADAASASASASVGDTALQATTAIHKVEAALPSIGRDTLLIGAGLAAVVAFAYGLSRKA